MDGVCQAVPGSMHGLPGGEKDVLGEHLPGLVYFRRRVLHEDCLVVVEGSIHCCQPRGEIDHVE